MLMSVCFYPAVDTVYWGADEMILLCYLMLIFCVIYCFWQTLFFTLRCLGRGSLLLQMFLALIPKENLNLCFFAFTSVVGGAKLLYFPHACHSYKIPSWIQYFTLLLCFVLSFDLVTSSETGFFPHIDIYTQDVINAIPQDSSTQWQIFNKEWASWSVSYVSERRDRRFEGVVTNSCLSPFSQWELSSVMD